MGDGTAIEWTDATWNPIIGCSRTSPGCDNCYAIGVVHRQMSPQHVGLTVKPGGGRVDWTGEVRPAPQVLTQPIRWKRPRRIFVNSLSDLFHADLPDEEIAKVFAVMALAPQHTFQVLTKRSKRMRDLLSDGGWRERVHLLAASNGGTERLTWPLPNVWLGVSIENDSYAFRADHLRDTPASVRWISAEPLLGPLPSVDLAGIGWLVAGGESGAGARPMDPAWVRDLRDRCATSETAFLFKQWGAWAPDGAGVTAAGRPWKSPDGKAAVLIGAPDIFQMRQIMRRVGKKAAGRELDGRTWDQYPRPQKRRRPSPNERMKPMCEGCVEDYMAEEGLATLEVPPDLAPLVARIAAFYELPGCVCGGPLHIVLDDTNVEDCNIDWCLAPERDRAHYPPVVWDAAATIAADLRAIPSLAMRAAVTVAW